MPENLRIFVDGHCFDKEYQGTQTFVRELYTELANYPGVDTYFGVRNTQKLLKALPFLKPSQILTYRNQRFPLQRMFFDIPRIIKNNNFHFAHFQNISPFSKNGCKYIVTLHDVLFKDFKNQFPFIFRTVRHILFKKSIQTADLKTTVSLYSAERIKKHYKISPDSLFLIPNGVNRKETLSKKASINFISTKYKIENFILVVSRIEPRKNQELILDVYSELALEDRNIPLVFIGKNSISNPGFRRKVNQNQKVHWIEQVEAFDLAAFYKACRLFIYPSKAEGFGIPPLEAAMHEVPVLCSNKTALKEFSFFEPYSFDPGNIDGLKEKIIQMLDHPPSHGELSQLARDIENKYGWQLSAKKFFENLQSHK